MTDLDRVALLDYRSDHRDPPDFAGFGGHPIRAWLRIPTRATEPLPAVVQFHGYASGGATADPVGSPPSHPGFLTRGIEDPHDYFYRRVFADAVRAMFRAPAQTARKRGMTVTSTKSTKSTKSRMFTALGMAAVAVLGLVSCSSDEADASTVNWWTWDDKQAAAYQSCVDAFQKANSGVTVKISQYAVEDYFTKLTAGFVAGDAPDAFQNSVQFFQAYTSQHQLLALDDLIKNSTFDMSRFSVGVDAWKFTDGKLYGLPLDWAATGIFYNVDAITKAGYTANDVATLNWNPDNGGTFEKMVAHLTIDQNGVRGDQQGFDKTKVAIYGAGELAAKDFIGQTTWSSFVSTMGWRQGDKASWPTKFNYADPNFVKTMGWVRSLTDRGYAPKLGEFTTSEVDQLGSGKVALLTGGSWTASTFAKIPNLKVGIAPTVLGPDNKTRSMLSNSNGNNIWAGTKHQDLTWKWVSYMGSEECQTMASKTGTFFPSIAASMNASAAELAKEGIDLSVFTDALRDGVLYPATVYGNGAQLQSVLEPLFERYFSHARDADVFPEMEQKSKEILAKSGQS